MGSVRRPRPGRAECLETFTQKAEVRTNCWGPNPKRSGSNILLLVPLKLQVARVAPMSSSMCVFVRERGELPTQNRARGSSRVQSDLRSL